MPAPIDWTAAGGIDSVKQLTINHGPREAARMLQLAPAHAEALKRKCSRECWLSPNAAAVPTGPRRVSPQPPQPVQRVPMALPNAAALLASSRVTALACPQSVPNGQNLSTTASEAQAEANAENSRAGRADLLRYGARAARRLAEINPDEAIERAPQAASVAKVLSVAGDWQAASGAGVSVNILVQ